MRTTALHRFTVEPAREIPVAAVNPVEQSKVVGAIISLDGRASTGDEDLTYAWSFVSTPLGSTVTTFSATESDGSVVTFVPDVTGQYTVGLVVSTPYRQSAQVEAVVEATAILVPMTLRTTPNGEIIFRVVSSFWKMVERNAVFSTIWSGYMQVVSTDLLRTFQVDAEKSIATIQSLNQRRWLDYAPALELDSALCTGVFGYHQGGTGAFTASGSVASTGIIISAQEIVLLDGSATLDAVGTTLIVYTSHESPGNTGSYTINRLNSDASGYILSSSTNLPSPEVDLLVARSTLVTFAGSTTVYDSDETVDFAALGVEVGDVLRLSTGSDSGYYRVRTVGVLNARTLVLDRAVTTTSSGRGYAVFNRLRIAAEKDSTASTRVVFIPEAEADLTSFAAKTLSGSGTLMGPYEILVESRHLFAALVGEKIQFNSRSFTITGINAAGTGYLLGASAGTSRFPTSDTSYTLQSSADIADRLLILEGEAYAIVTAELVDGTDVGDGGRGSLWVITLEDVTAPSGREGMEWRIAAAVSTAEYEDLEAEGVTGGDLLVLEVTRSDSQFVGTIPCYVLGAAGNRIAFDFGSVLGADGATGALTDDEILALANDLKIPRAYTDDSGVVQLTLLAEDLKAFVLSTTFESTYANLPLGSTTVIDLDESYQVTLGIKKIIRNTRVPVDDTLVSVPSLFEYIDTPTYGTMSDGTITLVGKYGESKTLDRAPLELIENRDYSLSSDTSTTGKNLETTAGSALFVIPGGNLIDRDVRVGDFIDITSGFDQGRYYVRSVRDNETMLAVTDAGVKPKNTASGLSFTLTRRTAGNFVRFVDGMFTPESPAPDHLWAQVSLFDNSPTIEDNFGVMVGVTKEQLDEYGSSQVTYKGAVQALMFAWASGPTVRNVTTGAHILMGLPVTEGPGRILQIDKTYDTVNSRGRILVEELDHEGQGTRLVRIYYFSSDDSDGLGDFQGVANNPRTGAEYVAGDVVPSFAALSKSVIVSDYLTDPSWWKLSSATGATELQKFHTWQVMVDASQVDSRDMQLISDFCSGIRPVYTKPNMVLVRYLADDVTVEDQFTMEGDLFLSDDPVLSVEATHMVDSYNRSSQSQRILDYGSFSTRTLFEGLDLVTTAGSSTVTSARGGFMGALDETPLDHAPLDPVGFLPSVNEWFPDPVYYRGTPLVRVGDILLIRAGNNRGRYTVTSVVSNTEITIDELPDYPPTTRPTSEIEALTDQAFQIQRHDTPIITSGLAMVSSVDEVAETSVLYAESGNFQWEGVAVGDSLLALNGDDYGVHEILQVGTWLDGDIVDRSTTIIVRGVLTLGPGPFDFSIRREGLRENPILSITDLTTTATASTVTSLTGGLQLLGLLPGDLLLLQSGSDEARYIGILDVVDDTTLYLDAPLTSTETAILADIIRPSVFESGDPRDDDWELTKFCAQDDVDIVIVEPRTLVVSAPDMVFHNDVSDPLNWVATATSATVDLTGVTTTMTLDVPVALAADADAAEDPPASPDAVNSGTRRILSNDAGVVTISGMWLAEETGVTADFYELAADWTAVDATATLGTSTLEDKVMPGDVLELDGLGTFVIASAAGSVLTLTRDTGADPLASYTGRVTRRL